MSVGLKEKQISAGSSVPQIHFSYLEKQGSDLDILKFSALLDSRLSSTLDLKQLKFEISYLVRKFFDLNPRGFGEMYSLLSDSAFRYKQLEETAKYELLMAVLIEVKVDKFLTYADDGELSRYGLKREWRFQNHVELTWQLKNQLVITMMSGGAYVCEALRLEEVHALEISSTTGMWLGQAHVDDGQANGLATLRKMANYANKQLVIVDDTCDSASSLVELLSNLLQGEIQFASDLVRARDIVYDVHREMVYRRRSTSAREVASFRIYTNNLRKELRSLLNRILSQANIKLVIAADKFFADTLMGNGFVTSLVPNSFALRDEEVLAIDQMPWLMGLGLDTAIEHQMDADEFNVSIGRGFRGILSLNPAEAVGENAGMNGIQLMNQLVTDVMQS